LGDQWLHRSRVAVNTLNTQISGESLMSVARALNAAAALVAASMLAFPGIAAAQGTFTVDYDFPGANSIGNPHLAVSPFTYLSGTLYGETEGGTYNKGTVISATKNGVVQLYNFGTAANDAAAPYGGLTYYNGKFYGLGSQGGTAGLGAVFSITPGGVEAVLYSFAGAPEDGAQPASRLIVVNGVLYGTTNSGGTDNAGTLFSITPRGHETVLHSFTAGPDGATPAGNMLAIGSTLYGTASYGNGSANCPNPYSSSLNGCGTLFSSDLAGNVTTLHSFQGAADGAEPISLVNVSGTLYGTAEAGASSANCGAAFTYQPASAAFAILHVFAGPPADACIPTSLALDGNTFYGTGIGTNPIESAGSIFSMTGAGATSLDVVFNNADGNTPNGPLLLEGGTFYSTTEEGGIHNEGEIFSYNP
jgi:uncharacterized repeat protein (TIGR03803 family)